MEIKKIFLITLFLSIFCIFNAFSQEESVIIETNLGKIKVYIPDNYNDLKDYYIDLMKLYLDTKYDLQTSIDNNDELISYIEDLKDEIKKLIELTNESNKLLKLKAYPSLIEHMLFVNYNFKDNNVGLGYGIFIIDSIYLSSYLNLPSLSFNIQLGYKF